MTRKTRSRLVTPGIAAVAGTAVAAAVGMHQNWATAVASELIALSWGAGLYFWSGAGTDTGSVLGRQGDERQQLVGLRATRLTVAVIVAALAASCLIAAALATAIWPYEALPALIGVSYLVGLRVYSLDGSDVDAANYSVFGFRHQPCTPGSTSPTLQGAARRT